MRQRETERGERQRERGKTETDRGREGQRVTERERQGERERERRNEQNELLLIVLQDVIAFLLNHLKRIVRKSETNKMDSSSLSTCFGPLTLCPPYQTSTSTKEADFRKQAEVLRYIIEIWPEEKDFSFTGWFFRSLILALCCLYPLLQRFSQHELFRSAPDHGH